MRAAARGWLWFMDGAILDWLDHRDMSRTELRDLLLGSLAGVAQPRRAGAPDPALLAALDLLLPDRRLGLHPVDDLARSRERLAAVRRRHRHDHARLRERHVAHAVLHGGGAEAVRLERLRRDRAHPLLGHLGVGLVLEPLHLARHAGEGHDRAGARVAHARGQRVERQRLLAHPHPRRRGGRAAAHRRDQGELVARVEHVLAVRVLAVHGHHERDAVGERRRAARSRARRARARPRAARA